MGKSGAVGPTRTDDLSITNALLYQLSYNGLRGAARAAASGERIITEPLARAYDAAPERTRTMISTPSATIPSGRRGSPETDMASASTSISSPVSTL